MTIRFSPARPPQNLGSSSSSVAEEQRQSNVDQRTNEKNNWWGKFSFRRHPSPQSLVEGKTEANRAVMLRQEQSPLFQLPIEVLLLMVSKLSGTGSLNLSLASKLTYDIVNDPSPWNPYLKPEHRIGDGRERRKKFYTEINARNGNSYNKIQAILAANTDPIRVRDKLLESAEKNLEIAEIILEFPALKSYFRSEDLIQIASYHPKLAETIVGLLKGFNLVKIAKFHPTLVEIIAGQKDLLETLDGTNLIEITRHYPTFAETIAGRKDLFEKLSGSLLIRIVKLYPAFAETIAEQKDLFKKLEDCVYVTGNDLVAITRLYPKFAEVIVGRKKLRQKLNDGNRVEVTQFLLALNKQEDAKAIVKQNVLHQKLKIYLEEKLDRPQKISQ